MRGCAGLGYPSERRPNGTAARRNQGTIDAGASTWLARSSKTRWFVDNVTVHSTVKGIGIGRLLLQFAEAEARRRGHRSIYLATHELVVENRVLCARIGYVEYDRRVVNGFPRAFFRKARG